jgi:WD40 repeat protein
MAITGDGKFMASVHQENSNDKPRCCIVMWRVDTGEIICMNDDYHHIGYWVNFLEFSKDGRYLASGGFVHDESIRIWSFEDRENLVYLKRLSGQDEAVAAVEFSHDGRRLANLAQMKTIKWLFGV